MELNYALHAYLTAVENRWLVFGVAAFLMMDGLLLIFFHGKFGRKHKIKADTNDTKLATRSRKKSSLVFRVLGYLFWLFGLLLAGYAFKFGVMVSG